MAEDEEVEAVGRMPRRTAVWWIDSSSDSKQNKTHNVATTGIMRHRDIDACLIGGPVVSGITMASFICTCAVDLDTCE